MPVQELFAVPAQSEKKKEEAFIVRAVIRYFEKPEAGRTSSRQEMESSILSALHRYFDTPH